jgi:hypothetical protein
MKVLVACEFSGIVRDTFRKQGYNAWSCDLLPSEKDSEYHIQEDVRYFLDPQAKVFKWDLMIAHPPCRYLAVSGARWFKDRMPEQRNALEFIHQLLSAPIKHICLENPVGVISTYIRKPDQYIQPWQFGHGETKKTGLWLKNLPLLQPTNIVSGRDNRVHREPPGKDRWKNRSRFYPGIAKAMATQWGRFIKDKNNK